jgi:hypothetical protein
LCRQSADENLAMKQCPSGHSGERHGQPPESLR